MTAIKRALIATTLAAVTVGVFADESELVLQLADALRDLSARWQNWHDAATVALAEPGALAVVGVSTLALAFATQRWRRRDAR